MAPPDTPSAEQDILPTLEGNGTCGHVPDPKVWDEKTMQGKILAAARAVAAKPTASSPRCLNAIELGEAFAAMMLDDAMVDAFVHCTNAQMLIEACENVRPSLPGPP